MCGPSPILLTPAMNTATTGRTAATVTSMLVADVKSDADEAAAVADSA